LTLESLLSNPKAREKKTINRHRSFLPRTLRSDLAKDRKGFESFFKQPFIFSFPFSEKIKSHIKEEINAQ
jgi:hypothetical protein